MKIQSIHPILLGTVALMAATSLFAGIHRPDKPTGEEQKELLREAQIAVQLQVIERLPYKIKGSMFSRRLIIPDPQYHAEFTKTPDSSQHMAFVLTKRAKEEKTASKISNGYYDPATQKVYLLDEKKRIYVMADKHPLLEGAPKAGQALRR